MPGAATSGLILVAGATETYLLQLHKLRTELDELDLFDVKYELQ